MHNTKKHKTCTSKVVFFIQVIKFRKLIFEIEKKKITGKLISFIESVRYGKFNWIFTLI